MATPRLPAKPRPSSARPNLRPALNRHHPIYAPSDRPRLHLTPQETAMTFAIRNLSVLSYAQGFTLWHYKAGAASLADVSADGFFDPAADMIAAGDMMMISAPDGGRLIVVAASGKSVRTAALC